ncbi:ABC transporter ATP-binding protein/permease [Staphylococcus equorum]|uniref:ABC transporter ATP-binding protein n=1 Tax=Staphylococcus equorum TaxID=246432 RepID=UPI002407E499|nr:ABC transporter ATP-binding protein [Staphylococcus equorum]MDG0824874.1 ABC transporter ATP-binding protein/permease [Staphylococcus equorum]
MKITNLIKLASISKKLFALSLIISIISTLLGLIMPIYLKIIIDQFQRTGLKSLDIILIIVLFISSAILGSISLYIFKYIGSKSMLKIRSRIWENVLKLDLATIYKYESGEIISRLKNDIEELNYFLTNTIPNALNYSLTFLGALIMLFILDYKIMFITIAIIPMVCLIIFPIGNITYKLSLKLQDQLSIFTSKLNNVLTNIKLVKAYTFEFFEYKRINKIMEKILEVELKDAKVKAVIAPIMSLVTIGTILFIVGYATFRISNGTLSTGTFIAILYYVLQIIPAIISFTTLYNEVQKVRGANEKINELLSDDNLETEKILFHEVQLDLQELKIRNVTFKFDKTPILKNINLTIKPGETIAIVGPSGAGKSTLFDLILGLYKDYVGEIIYGDKNIKDINIIDWRNTISYVPQENNIMSGTILDNIIYGKKSIVCFDAIQTVCSKSNLIQTVSNSPKNFLTATGENGIFLSGGQRQRIALSRAMMKNSNITKFMRNKTCLIIAHRMSTIKNVDRIVFMENGSITGLGSHHELYNSHKLYKLFIDSQNRFK